MQPIHLADTANYHNRMKMISWHQITFIRIICARSVYIYTFWAPKKSSDENFQATNTEFVNVLTEISTVHEVTRKTYIKCFTSTDLMHVKVFWENLSV